MKRLMKLCLRSCDLLGSHGWTAVGEKGQKGKQGGPWVHFRAKAVQ